MRLDGTLLLPLRQRPNGHGQALALRVAPPVYGRSASPIPRDRASVTGNEAALVEVFRILAVEDAAAERALDAHQARRSRTMQRMRVGAEGVQLGRLRVGVAIRPAPATHHALAGWWRDRQTRRTPSEGHPLVRWHAPYVPHQWEQCVAVAVLGHLRPTDVDADGG
jgi:hypothetical protein